MIQFKSSLVLAAAFLGFMSNAESKELIQCTARMYMASETSEPAKVKFKVITDAKKGSTLQINQDPAAPVLNTAVVKISKKQFDRARKCDINSDTFDTCIGKVYGKNSFYDRGPLQALLLMAAYGDPELAPAGAPKDNEMAAEKKFEFDLSKIALARMFHVGEEADSQFGSTGLVEYYDTKGALLGMLVQAVEVSTCK